MVVYSLFVGAVERGGLDCWLNYYGYEWTYAAFAFPAKMFLGALWGITFGIGSVLFLQVNKHVDADANVEITITLAMPFFVYYTAEMLFPDVTMSGVLATVFFGLVFATTWGRTKLDPKTEHFLHEFWSMVGYLVNTLIFTISGLIIVINVFGTILGKKDASRNDHEHLSWVDIENGEVT